MDLNPLGLSRYHGPQWSFSISWDSIGSISFKRRNCWRAVVGGLFFTGLSFRDNFQSRQVATLIELTSSHRDIWENLFTHAGLARITKREVDLCREPITEHERLIVRLLILHLNAAYHAAKISDVVRLEGIHTDIRQFFAAPIPGTIWAELRKFQNRDFVRFVESHF